MAYEIGHTTCMSVRAKYRDLYTSQTLSNTMARRIDLPCVQDNDQGHRYPTVPTCTCNIKELHAHCLLEEVNNQFKGIIIINCVYIYNYYESMGYMYAELKNSWLYYIIIVSAIKVKK